MRFCFAFLLLLLPTETLQHQLDLEPLLHDDKALQKLTVMYRYEPRGNHGYQMFFIHGDGSLLSQAHPARPIANSDIPTCRNRISRDKVKELVCLIIQRRFWDLPDRNFLFLYISQPEGEIDLHTIAVDDGLAKARRSFAVGRYAENQESMPADFAAIQEQLEQLKDFTLHTPEKPCHFAPAVKFWE
jgi:hypothetical protein